MSLDFLNASLSSARSVAPYLERQGFDTTAYLSHVTAVIHDVTGSGLGAKGVSPTASTETDVWKWAAAQLSSPAAGAGKPASEHTRA